MSGDPRDPFPQQFSEAFRTVRIRVHRSGPLYGAAAVVVLAVGPVLVLPLLLLALTLIAVGLLVLWVKRVVSGTRRSSPPRSDGRQNVRIIDRTKA